MAETKFTPGPWTAIIRGERGTFHIPETVEDEALASLVDGLDGGTVSGANARLIAAAPDLYAALLAICEAPHDADGDALWVDGMAALAKARGQ